jgi:hypothetical protein
MAGETTPPFDSQSGTNTTFVYSAKV